MKIVKIGFIVFCVLLIQCFAFAQGIENYIIQNDVGVYKFRPKPSKEIFGNSGVVISADHFDEDHDDISYVTRYIKPEPILGVDVQVTQHTGGDSDRWMLHEAETSFRDGDNLEIGPDEDTMIRIINNNKIFFYGGGVVGYRWISNNVLVNVQYTNLSGPKPEPVEVVQAYLEKYPSTITLTDAELRTSIHNVKWIKDEIERRLWLCDKWNAQFQSGGVAQADLIYNLNRSIGVFLNYRQKYYGVSAEADLALLSGYQQNNDIASIQAKLIEHKTWWAKNKEKNISLR